MSRTFVPIAGSICIVDSTNQVLGFSIQNVGPVDLYYSDDQRLLDSVDPSNLPTVGHILATATPTLQPVVYTRMANKKVYIRAQSSGGQVECFSYPVELCT